MRRPELNTRRQRIESAELSGHVEWVMHNGGEMTMDELVAELHTVSRDPDVLGNVLGSLLYRARESTGLEPLLEALRLAGADGDLARDVLEWQEWKRERDAHADGPTL